MLSLSVLTYDSLPFIHFSVYRPVAMFPLFLASILLLFEKFRFGKGDFFLIGFCVYSVCHSLVICMGYGSMGASMKHIFTLMIGLGMYRVALYIGQLCKEDPKIRRMMAISLWIAFLPPIAIGCLQLVDSFIVKSGFSMSITGLFSEKVYLRRIQLLSGEPSWAAIHVLSGGLIMSYLIRLGYRSLRIPLVLSVLLMVLSFSAYAYSVILIALIFYIVLTSKNRGRMLLILGGTVAFVAVFIPFLIDYLHISGYFAKRFQFDFQAMLKTDNSVFVRFVFPLIGVYEFLRHPVFGLGGGYYFYEFNAILFEKFSYGLKFKEVYDIAYVMPDSATSRNLFAKVLSEEGIVGFMLFIGFLSTAVKGSSPYAKFALALCFSLVMNFDSYSFVNFWLLIGFIRGGFFNEMPAAREAGTETLSTKGMKQIA
ncbi:O-antigen ligase family protein [Paenibacillus glycinis]|nr:O-antigen ligase family protein [Paenibacillus glycinis]